MALECRAMANFPNTIAPCCHGMAIDTKAPSCHTHRRIPEFETNLARGFPAHHCRAASFIASYGSGAGRASTYSPLDENPYQGMHPE